MRLVLLLSAVLSVANTARILAVLPFPGKSHYIFHKSILRTLIQRGHQVVEYGPFPLDNLVPNHTYVEVHSKFEDILGAWKYEDFMKFSDCFTYFGQGVTNIWELLDDICRDIFQHENIRKLLKSDEKFDLVFTTSTFGQESMTIFGHKFRAPTITLQGFAYSSILNHPSGNVLSIATIPDTMSFPFSSEMTLLERFRNMGSVLMSLFKFLYFHIPNQDAIMKENYKVPNPPSVAEMINNISLTFINANPGVQDAIPYTPNIIPIAGISIVPERKPLPKDILKFMDEAQQGVIYFSLGSNLPIHKFPKEFQQMFLNVFKSLPQRVLWKHEAEYVPGLPENVKLSKWVPQVGVIGLTYKKSKVVDTDATFIISPTPAFFIESDFKWSTVFMVLRKIDWLVKKNNYQEGHPNCVLFITHGGLFSQQEAIHAGVPTIGIPYFADQPYNINFNEKREIGVGLDLKTLTEDSILSAIHKVLENPKYKENAQRLSKIFHDRPVSPADSVVFWTEYVLRHKGAHHLRPASTRLSWYQLALLDVLGAILLCIVIIVTLVYFLFKRILALLFGKNKETKVSKSKKLK